MRFISMQQKKQNLTSSHTQPTSSHHPLILTHSMTTKELADMPVDELIERNKQILEAKASLVLASSMTDEDIKNHATRADNVKLGQYIKLAALSVGAFLLVLITAFFLFR